METLTNNTEQVFLVGPLKNHSNNGKPDYYKVTVAKSFIDPEPRWCYRIYDRDKAIATARKIAYDRYLSLASKVLIPDPDETPNDQTNPVDEEVEPIKDESPAPKPKGKSRTKK